MYIGNDLQIAHPSYKIIDDISSGFNGSTTSFALQVSGATPVPFPISTQQVMISVNGVVQEPDPNGNAGFKLLGSNIVFSSAPANGHAFFGVINAGADYVTAGSEFPDGSATAPSFTFQDDQDTGWYRSGSGAVGFSANGVNTIGFDGNGLTVTGDATFTGDSSKNLFWDKSDGQLEFADNAKAVFGTGSDLSIYHDTNNSFISSSTGNLKLVGNANILIEDNNGETLASFNPNSSVDLYHNNVNVFKTDGNGIMVKGPEGGTANIYLYSDEGDDNADKFQLTVNDGGPFHIQNRASGGVETNIKCFGEGAVELYHDNVKILETFANGLVAYGPEGGACDIYLYADEGDDNADRWKIEADTSGNFKVGNKSTGSWVDKLFINAAGSVGLGTSSPECLLDLQSGSVASGTLMLGGNYNAAGLTNNAAKHGAIHVPHYDISTYPKGFKAIGGYADNGVSLVQIGGGTNDVRAATDIRFYTSTNATANGSEVARLDSSGRLLIGTTTEGAAAADNLTIADSGNAGISIRTGTNSQGAVYFSDGTSGVEEYRGQMKYLHSNNSLEFVSNSVSALIIDSSQNAAFAGTVSDSKGDLRKIPINAQTSAYTLVLADAGKCVTQTHSGGVNVPYNRFSAGDAITIINNSGSDISIVQGSSNTMYNSADGATGNRTLSTRGMATVFYQAHNICYISGAGLS